MYFGCEEIIFKYVYKNFDVIKEIVLLLEPVEKTTLAIEKVHFTLSDLYKKWTTMKMTLRMVNIMNHLHSSF